MQSLQTLKARGAFLICLAVTLLSCGMLASAQSLTFHGYPCTEDCSGHEAGYDWAGENNLNDESDCDGNSQSFIEGCLAYVEENTTYEEDEEDYEDDY